MRRLLLSAAMLAALLWAAFSPAPARAAPVCTLGGTLGVQLVIDDSGSMAGNDPQFLRAAASRLVIDQLPNQDTVGAISFGTVATTLFSPTVLDASNREPLKDAIDATLSSSAPSTRYGPAFELAVQEIALSGADRTAVIFLSDGEPTDGEPTEHLALGVPVFTVGLGNFPGEVLRRIATDTGGEYFPARDAADVQNAFATIVSRLRCEDPLGVFDDFLLPGQSVEREIPVPPTAAELRATATWAEGDFLVEIIDPAGGRYGPVGPYPPSIVYTKAPTFVTFGATDPSPGAWRIRIEALLSNPPDAVRITSQITFRNRLTTAPPPVGPPPPPEPPPGPAGPECNPTGDPDAVVLVDGLNGNSSFSDSAVLTFPNLGAWGVISAGLRRDGFRVIVAPSVNAEEAPPEPVAGFPPTAVLRGQASVISNGGALSEFTRILKSHCGVQRMVLVGYSMGGLVARDLVGFAGTTGSPTFPEVRGVVTLGTPHAGSFLADGLACGVGFVAGLCSPARFSLRSAQVQSLNRQLGLFPAIPLYLGAGTIGPDLTVRVGGRTFRVGVESDGVVSSRSAWGMDNAFGSRAFDGGFPRTIVDLGSISHRGALHVRTGPRVYPEAVRPAVREALRGIVSQRRVGGLNSQFEVTSALTRDAASRVSGAGLAFQARIRSGAAGRW